MNKIHSVLPVAAALLLAACGGRTTAATQPAPEGWDPAKNDPKAVEIATKMVESLGGGEAWAGVKQLSWGVTYDVNGEIKAIFHHDWDRWNGRHRFRNVSMQSYADAKATGDMDKVQASVAMYKLFERGSGTAMWNGQDMPGEDKKKAIEAAYSRWQQDSYMLTFAHKVFDPGAILSYEGKASDDNCPDGCEVIKVTFDPSVGKDAYYINVSNKTGLPHLLEIELAGQTGRIAYTVMDWIEVEGLKFPTKLDNLGTRNAGRGTEMWVFDTIEIDEPDDSLYIPQVR